MAAFLAEHGIKVTHTTSLEALTVAVGDKTFRRFQTLLRKPGVPQIPESKRWFVTSVYADNDQPFDEYYSGTDALEAAVNCQVERLADEYGSEVQVVSVLDRTTDRIADTGNVGDTDIATHGFALRSLVDTAKDLVRMDSTLMGDEADALAARILFLDEFLGEPGTTPAGERRAGAGEEYLDRVLDKRAAHGEDGVLGSLEGYGLTQDLDPVEAVRTVAQYVLDCVQVKGWAGLSEGDLRNVYHAKALTVYLGPQLRGILVEERTLSLSEHADEVHVLDANVRTLTWFDVLDQQIEKEAGMPADRIVFNGKTGSYHFKRS
ncbi:hypothetical protein AS149_31820 [Burkholderia cenocepacia]|nr:hypothetical protein AS149_31820 [Burkholderia cenocepacia]